jgi:hypothetical protein
VDQHQIIKDIDLNEIGENPATVTRLANIFVIFCLRHANFSILFAVSPPPVYRDRYSLNLSTSLKIDWTKSSMILFPKL